MNDKEQKIIEVVQETLREDSKNPDLVVNLESKLNNPKEWDSLNFVRVFMAVVEKFDLDVDDDDAIEFTSIRGMIEFID